MVTLQPITAENLHAFKTVRLRALADSPSAFGSTFARESAFTDEEWLVRVKRWNGESGIGFIAMDGEPCGIAGALFEADKSGRGETGRADLVSMWTAPTHRQRGVGRLLVDAVIDWARLKRVKTLKLMVTSKNETAICFYTRLGFAMTGRTEPYPNDAALLEYEMVRSVSCW